MNQAPSAPLLSKPPQAFSAQRRQWNADGPLTELEIAGGEATGSVQRSDDGGNDKISLEPSESEWVWEGSVRTAEENQPECALE